MVINDKGVPFVGLVSEDGYVESYGLENAARCDYHHNYTLSPKGIRYYYKDNTLRIVRYANEDKYTLEGSPVLDPFGKGFDQIRIFARHCLEYGAEPDVLIKVADHKLGTKYDGEILGSLKLWANQG